MIIEKCILVLPLTATRSSTAIYLVAEHDIGMRSWDTELAWKNTFDIVRGQ
jgi:hypothetical protein